SRPRAEDHVIPVSQSHVTGDHPRLALTTAGHSPDHAHVNRRRFLLTSLAGALAAPTAARGHSPRNVRRVVILHQRGPYEGLVDGLRQGLRELGLEEGSQIVLEIRATSDLKAVEEAARDLERGRIDLLYTAATSVTIAAKRATVHTPIVFFA